MVDVVICYCEMLELDLYCMLLYEDCFIVVVSLILGFSWFEDLQWVMLFYVVNWCVLVDLLSWENWCWCYGLLMLNIDVGLIFSDEIYVLQVVVVGQGVVIVSELLVWDLLQCGVLFVLFSNVLFGVCYYLVIIEVVVQWVDIIVLWEWLFSQMVLGDGGYLIVGQWVYQLQMLVFLLDLQL